MLRGIDASRWNDPGSVPWGEVDFGFVRLSYGLHADLRAEEHLRRGREAGKLLGGYHWLDGSKGGAEQAELFLKQASDSAAWGTSGNFDPLALAVDVEPADPRRPDPPDRVRRELAAFLYRVDRAAVYVNLAEATRLGFANFADLARPDGSPRPLWLADWTPPYAVPKPWDRWTVLQTGKKGGVDRDVFEGSAEDFRRAFGLCSAAEDRSSAMP